MRISRIILPLWLAGALLAGTARAETFDAAAASAKADLDKALAELSALRQQIANEKLPLAKKLNDIENAVLSKRAEFDRIQRQRGSKTFDIETLRAEVKSRRDENVYVTSLLDEYTRAYESRIHISELQRYKDAIADAKLAIEDVNISAADKFGKQISLVRVSLDRIENLVGGERFEAKALSTRGTLEPGKVALIGPIAVFAADQSKDAGICELQLGTVDPSVISIGDQFNAGIREIVQTGKGELPVDPTLGSAIKIAGTRDTLWQHIRKGGPVMVPIIGLALVAGVVSIIKWIQISGIRLARPEDLQQVLSFLNAGRKNEALDYAGKVKGPAGELLSTAVNNAHESKQLIEEALYEKLLATKPRLERMLAFIAVTAATEPLLGLLGTVTGIIRTFKLITVFGTGDPKLLSGGISEALITTEFGLYFAIPGLLVHALLSRKVRGVLASMEQTVVGFINGLKNGR
jgi:biopolymer transport protein ExbB